MKKEKVFELVNEKLEKEGLFVYKEDIEPLKKLSYSAFKLFRGLAPSNITDKQICEDVALRIICQYNNLFLCY